MCNPCEFDADLARAARKARRTYRRSPLVAPTRNCVAIPENTEKVRVHVPPKLIGIEIYDTSALRTTLNDLCLGRGSDVTDGFTPAMTHFLSGKYNYVAFRSWLLAFRALGLSHEDLAHCVRPILSKPKTREVETHLYTNVCRATKMVGCAGHGIPDAIRSLSCLPLETIRNLLLRDMVKRMSRAKMAEVLGVSRRVIQNWLTEIGER